MADEVVVVCACGFEARGERGAVVATMLEHGRDVHNMHASREEILAMAQPADPRPA